MSNGSLRYMTAFLASLILLIGLVGCEHADVTRLRDTKAAEAAGTVIDDATNPDLHLDTEVTLSRKMSRKTGRPIGVGEEFRIAEKSSVYGIVSFEGVDLDRNHTVHLVWVRPDGKAMFRRYVDVVVSAIAPEDEAAGEDRYEATILRKKAEDLHYLKETVTRSATPGFKVSSKLNISTKKERVPGDYRLQVYLDRRFLLEKSFSVLPAEES